MICLQLQRVTSTGPTGARRRATLPGTGPAAPEQSPRPPRFRLTWSFLLRHLRGTRGTDRQVHASGSQEVPSFTSEERRRATMHTDSSGPKGVRRRVDRREFLKRAGWSGVGVTALVAGTRSEASVRRRDVAVPRLDPGQPQAAEAGRHPHAGVGVGSAGARSAAHEFGRALPVRRARQQPPRPLPVLRRGDEHHRPHAQGRPRGVVAGRAPTTACGRSSSARASSGRTCRRSTGASWSPPTSSTASSSTRRKACRRSRSRRSRGWRRRTSTRCASTSRRPTRCSRRTSPSPSR